MRVAALVVAALAGPARASGAQGYASFRSFVDLDSTELTSVAIRIAPMTSGFRSRPVVAQPPPTQATQPNLPPGYGVNSPSGAAAAAAAGSDISTPGMHVAADTDLVGLLLTVRGGSPDTAVFTGYARPGHPVVWDESRVVRGEVSATRMRAALDAIRDVPEATAGTVDSMGTCLVTLIRGRERSLEVYEVSLERELAARVLRELTPRLAETPRLWSALAQWTCDCTTTGPVEDVSPRLSARLERFRWDPLRRELSASVVVRNRSREAIPGPITVAVRTSARSLRLLEPDGVSCRAFEPGVPVVRLEVTPATALAPGASVERVVRFANPRQMDATTDLFRLRAFAAGQEY
jgi:hypothetical protein